MDLSPTVRGRATIRANASAFVSAFVQRIETGLLGGASRSRSQYVVTQREAGRLGFRAVTFWTAIAVGLNDVDLVMAPNGQVEYTIRFRRWASYVLGLSGVVGTVLVIVFMMIDIREYIAQHPGSSFPGLSLDMNVSIAWAMALFWGLAWPWILIALHKRPLRRLMERIIVEVDTAATSSGPVPMIRGAR